MQLSPPRSAARLAPVLVPAEHDTRTRHTPARPLRIGVVTEYYYPHLGGISEHVHFFAREARLRGHHVDIITSRIEGAAPRPDVIRVGRSQPVWFNGSQARLALGVGLPREMREVFKKGRYDLVHVHSPLTPSLPFIAIDAADCPVIGTFHTYLDGSRVYGALRGWLQQKVDRLSASVAVSHAAARAIDRYFDVDWTIIPNGIDPELFNPCASAPAGWRDDVPVILFLGRFDPRNGLATLIEAFRKVRGRNRPARLVIVGDGPHRRRYYRAARGDPDIGFAGAVLDGRPAFYANATVYACPTTKASFGITLLEAMACETPVVCSDITGFREVVEHDREGLMFPCGDAGGLADSLVRLLDDDSLRARLGKSGRRKAESYAWPTVTSRILDLYASVLG